LLFRRPFRHSVVPSTFRVPLDYSGEQTSQSVMCKSGVKLGSL